jgi:N-acetylglutamate synthase-like GNAT family acetyltransferase
MMQLTLRTAAPDELAWINERYRSIDFRLSGADDFQAVAEVDGKPAGLGRIVPVEGRVGELGGMLVFDQYRGTGLSKAIIGFLAQTTHFDFLYCLPFANLEQLYASFGFRRVDPCAGVPAKVLEKYHWCVAFYTEPVLLMGREIGAVSAQRCAGAPPSS